MNTIKYSRLANGWYVTDEYGDARGGINDSYSEAEAELAEFIAAKPVALGDRVELPAHTDEWMRGLRFGLAVARHADGRTRVLLDKTGNLLWVATKDLKVVQPTVNLIEIAPYDPAEAGLD